MSTTRNMSQLGDDMAKRGQQIHDAINDRLPRLVADMLVDAFRKSWQLQRFNDTGSAPWEQVKRRTPGSSWYGFNYKSNSRVPQGSRGTTAKGNVRKPGSRKGITNFTSTATTRHILIGWGSAALRESIFVTRSSAGVAGVGTDKPYAQVHNEGGNIRIFGRATARVPKRQFMGHSGVAERQAKQLIDKVFDKIMNQ